MKVDFVLTESSGELGEVILSTVSRSILRNAVNTPLLIDVHSSADLNSAGQITFDRKLQYRAPSFNTINTPVNDAITLPDLYEIRNPAVQIQAQWAKFIEWNKPFRKLHKLKWL